MAFQSVKSLLLAAQEKPLWQAIQENDCQYQGITTAESWEKMSSLWQAMLRSVHSYNGERRSTSGLVGGAGSLMEQAQNPLCGSFVQQIIATALKTGECNACMGCIVAAPTAGASGVMPAVLIPTQEKLALSDEKMIQALYVAAGFGQVIAFRASISGAEGGCQAEIGSASAMAAAALVFLQGGTADQTANACAMAIKNLLGLVCDPVAGLVEVPCVKRNVIGAMNALSCAEMALAGISSAIPCDEVMDAMRAVGDCLPAALRETGMGGLASTPTARAFTQQFFK